nr:KH domain-containing protein [Tanacetum cinerariifolium]
ASENGQQEKETETDENDDQRLPVERSAEQEEGLGNADESIGAGNKEFVMDGTDASAVEQEAVENAEESAKVEIQGASESDVAQQGGVSSVEQHVTSDGQLSRKIEVPSNKVGALIGKAGDTIRSLQYNSGARIQITRDAEADPNSATRPVELIGSLESINKAEKLIKDVILEADAGGSPALVARGFSNALSAASVEQVQIQVPNEKVAFIIGKGGETIKNLQSRSGARIQVIPQHLPEGDQSKERTVRITGDKRQIEIARELIKESMIQPTRPRVPASGYNQQNFRPGGPGSQWGPRNHPSHPTGNDYPQRGPYSPNFSQGYRNYPPQPPPSRNNVGWDQRTPTNMQGPPDYYSGQGGHAPAPSGPTPMHSHASGPGPNMGPPPSQANYNYGQPQGPDYGQQPPPYLQSAPQGYSHGYGEPKYDNQGPAQHPPSAYQQGYAQQGQYGKPPAYNTPQQGPYPQPYGQPRPDVPYQGPNGPNAPAQQPYPYASSGPNAPAQQAYTQYPANDGYSHSAPGPGGYPPQSGQPVSGYAQTAPPQQAPGYAQPGPAASYSQYPATQLGFTEQAPTTNVGYGYQGATDGTYAGGPGTTYGGPLPVGQPAAYSQPAPLQPGYDQSIPQSGGYGNVPIQPQPQPQAQPGYGQYDNSQIFVVNYDGQTLFRFSKGVMHGHMHRFKFGEDNITWIVGSTSNWTNIEPGGVANVGVVASPQYPQV